MAILDEFKAFALKGNLIDFAVGVVVGGGFTKITSTFIDGIVMPLIGKVVGGQDFSELKFKIQDGTKEVLDASGNIVNRAVPEVYMRYGEFISAVIDFFMVALVMFFVVKAMNKLRKKAEEETIAVKPNQEILLEEIRDLLKNK
ncbi:MAG: large-conductance mechanosensitive channel protein MscL [Bacteroidota bacterium]|jgi:large conductance mechanosensitive channel